MAWCRLFLPLGLLLVVSVWAEDGPEVSGRVIDGSGQPVSGALVMLAPPGSNGGLEELPPAAAAWVSTAGNGSFRLAPPEPGTYHLDITARGFAPQRRPALTLAAGSKDLALGAVALAPEAVLEGRVLDLGRRPITGAKVYLYRRGWVPSRIPPEAPKDASTPLLKDPSAITDREGRFIVHGLVPGEAFEVSIWARGFAHASVESQRVPAEAPLEVVLRGQATVRGKVVDAEGKPVAGVRVDALANGLAERGMTDEQGAFRFGAGPGEIELRTVREGTSAAPLRLRLAPGEVSEPLTMVLHTLAPAPAPAAPEGPIQEISGLVMDAKGSPVAGAYIQAYRKDGKGWGTTTTDAVGGFSLVGLPQGSYRISAGTSGFLDSRIEHLPVGDRPVSGLRFVLDRGATVTGRILGLPPELLPGMRVWVNPDWANQSALDSEGRFRIAAVEPRPGAGSSFLVLDLQHRQRLNWALTILPGETEVLADLDLSRAVRVTGRLRREGKPVSGWVEVGRLGREEDPWKSSASASDDGRFELLGLEPGAYWLTVRGLGGDHLLSRQLEVMGDLDLVLDIAAEEP